MLFFSDVVLFTAMTENHKILLEFLRLIMLLCICSLMFTLLGLVVPSGNRNERYVASSSERLPEGFQRWGFWVGP